MDGDKKRFIVVGTESDNPFAIDIGAYCQQRADIADMTWDVAGVLAELSTLFHLEAGDLVYTGTPAGVGAIVPGDVVIAGIDGLGTVTTTVVQAR